MAMPKRIPRDTVSIVAGHHGLGKSKQTASLAAIVSTGEVYPVDRTRCEAGNVLLLSAEDGAERVLVPRLKAAGADLNKLGVSTCPQNSAFTNWGRIRRNGNRTLPLGACDV